MFFSVKRQSCWIGRLKGKSKNPAVELQEDKNRQNQTGQQDEAGSHEKKPRRTQRPLRKDP
jgi:hypothetical protein